MRVSTNFGLTHEGYGELTDKRSKFLCWVRPCCSSAEAKAYAAKLKQEHYKARHVCWAWVGQNHASSASDDGEPTGTAGKPMLSLLEGANLVDAAAYCVRYFGGTLLGTGGLTKAYKGACKRALEAAHMAPLVLMQAFEGDLPYAEFSSVEHTLAQVGGKLLSQEFGDTVHVELAVPKDAVDTFLTRVSPHALRATEELLVTERAQL